jgi:AraC-like DNA-binding protein
VRSVLEQSLIALRYEDGLDRGDRTAEIRKAVMRNSLKGDYSAAGLAQSLGMSISALQRQLHASGTSASRLIDETRHINAMGMLADSSLSIDEVAFRLGFESERGFRKAFQRWCGQSPAGVRKEMKQQEAVSVPA